MCPQANASTALLTNRDEFGEGQPGDQVLMKMSSWKVSCIDAEGSRFSYDKSVCGYLMAKTDKRGFEFEEFLVKPVLSNKSLPTNMYLLCGDHYLEVIAKRLDGERSLPPTKGGPWRKVTEFMKAFVDGVVAADKSNREYTFFIDTNPSFSIYTELAVLAANRLIVPFNADDFSRTAVKSILYFLYGYKTNNELQVKYEHLKEYEFWYRAQQENVILPQIFLLINNKITPYGKGVAKAFIAKEMEINGDIKGVIGKKPRFFVNPNDSEIIRRLNDFHTVAVQCLHLGCPLRNLPRTVAIENWTVENADKNKKVYLKQLEELVKLL